MFSFGMLTARAPSIARRSRGLPSGSPPPARAATVISRMILVQTDARRESVTAFFRLICFHLLWPAIATDSLLDWTCWNDGNISRATCCSNANVDPGRPFGYSPRPMRLHRSALVRSASSWPSPPARRRSRRKCPARSTCFPAIIMPPNASFVSKSGSKDALAVLLRTTLKLDAGGQLLPPGAPATRVAPGQRWQGQPGRHGAVCRARRASALDPGVARQRVQRNVCRDDRRGGRTPSRLHSGSQRQRGHCNRQASRARGDVQAAGPAEDGRARA